MMMMCVLVRPQHTTLTVDIETQKHMLAQRWSSTTYDSMEWIDMCMAGAEQKAVHAYQSLCVFIRF